MPNLFSAEPDFDTPRSDETDEGWPDYDDVMTEIKKLQLEEIETKDSDIDSVPVAHEEVVAEKKTLLSKLQSFEKKEEKPQAEIVTAKESAVAIELPKLPPRKVEVSEEDVRARQEYLKQQRDKLLALKKQVREKRLGAAESNDETGGGEGSLTQVLRPRSARVAQAALAGAAPPPTADAMQLRRALASKLKTEVVDTSH